MIMPEAPIIHQRPLPQKFLVDPVQFRIRCFSERYSCTSQTMFGTEPGLIQGWSRMGKERMSMIIFIFLSLPAFAQLLVMSFPQPFDDGSLFLRCPFDHDGVPSEDVFFVDLLQLSIFLLNLLHS
jgi:hypothetical protein